MAFLGWFVYYYNLALVMVAVIALMMFTLLHWERSRPGLLMWVRFGLVALVWLMFVAECLEAARRHAWRTGMFINLLMAIGVLAAFWAKRPTIGASPDQDGAAGP